MYLMHTYVPAFLSHFLSLSLSLSGSLSACYFSLFIFQFSGRAVLTACNCFTLGKGKNPAK